MDKMIFSEYPSLDHAAANAKMALSPLPATNTLNKVERRDAFVPLIVDNLGTELPLPEDIIINQDNLPTGND